MVVTVDLPLEPVMAMTGAPALSRRHCANSSMSPTTAGAARPARRGPASAAGGASPGLTTMRSNSG